MRIKHLFFMAVTAAFAFAACEDPIEGNDPGTVTGVTGDGNFWTTYKLVPKGIKSITESGFTDNFDKNGRLTSSSREDDSDTYSYNAEGYISKIESESRDWEGHLTRTTKTFEFNNGDKFCPIPMGPGNIFHIFENGLVKGLSKVTLQEDDSICVMEYKFKDNILTVSTSGGYWDQDTTGQDIFVRYDDIIIEYQGNYPYLLKDEHEFIGPITYQANGQFDTYVEGFYSWDEDYPGFITMQRTRTVNKNFKDKLLTEKEVGKYYNTGEANPWNIETITYTYNEKGDVISETTTNTASYSEDYLSTYEYEYDAKGNWIKCTVTTIVTRPSQPEQEPRVYTNEREIVYY